MIEADDDRVGMMSEAREGESTGSDHSQRKQPSDPGAKDHAKATKRGEKQEGSDIDRSTNKRNRETMSMDGERESIGRDHSQRKQPSDPGEKERER